MIYITPKNSSVLFLLVLYKLKGSELGQILWDRQCL